MVVYVGRTLPILYAGQKNYDKHGRLCRVFFCFLVCLKFALLLETREPRRLSKGICMLINRCLGSAVEKVNGFLLPRAVFSYLL